MDYRGKLLVWLGVVILLLLGGIGYLRGWFEIFGVGFDGTRASVSTQAEFSEGSFTDTEFKDGALKLKTTAGGAK